MEPLGSIARLDRHLQKSGAVTSAPGWRRLVFWLPITYILLSGAVVGSLLFLLREETIQSGERLTESFALLAEEQTTQTIRAVDQTLELVAVRLGDPSARTAAGADVVRAMLREVLSDRPFLGSIVVLDVQGRTIFQSYDSATGQDLSDWPYFKKYLDGTVVGFELNPPVKARLTGSWVISATRPWLRPSGELAGVIVGDSDPTYFSRVWSIDDANEGNTVALLRRDGTMLARSPNVESMLGKSFSDSVLFEKQLPRKPTGNFQTIGPVDGRVRLFTYRTLQAYPDFVISVSQTMDHVLAGWRRYSRVVVVGWVVSSVALGLLAAWLILEWRRRLDGATELQAARDRLTAVMDSAVDGLITIDQRGIVLSFSKPAERIFGYVDAEVIGRNVNMLMPEPYHSAHDGYIATYLKTGNAKIIGIGREVQGKRKDGVVFPMDLAVGEIPNTAGMRQFVGTVRDITPKKEAEERARQAELREAAQRIESQRRLETAQLLTRRVFETSADLILVVDSRGTIVTASPSALAILGHHPDDMVGQSAADFLYPPDLDRTRNEMRLVRSGKTRRSFECRYLNYDGRPVALAWSGVWSESDKQYFFTGRDMTAHNEAQTALNQASESLREAREMFAAIVEASPMAIVALNSHRRVLVWNRAAETITGYTAEETLGKPYPLVPTGGEAEFDHYFQKALQGESLRNIEVIRQRKDGVQRQLRFSGEPLYDAERRFRAVIYVLEDITDRNTTEEQLRQAQKMEAVGQLTGGIAHDFNNMLTVIVGNAEVLLAKYGADSRVRALTEMILKAADGSADLTSRLLAFARRQSLQPKRIETNPFVERTGVLLKRTLGEDIDVKLSLSADLWEVMIDPSQLESAILNLGINARDAMPGGGVLTIETANVQLDESYAAANQDAQVGEFVMIAVSDNGTGMAPEVAHKAFEPFFTTKEVGKGTGLGLSMVYGFVRQSGGHVKIYSELGEGTCIKMYLPRAIGTAAIVDAKAEDPGLLTGEGEAILLVEDEKLVRDYVESQLKDLGYTVVCAEDGKTALEILQGDNKIDLLFTDVIMPGGMSGRDLAVEARRHCPTLRVLFTSAYTRDAVAYHGRLDANVHLLSKPYRARELAAKVREVLSEPA